MKVTINLPLAEFMSLVTHLGWLGFDVPNLNPRISEIFRKTAKQIWDKVHSPEDQLKIVAMNPNSIYKKIYDYKLPEG